MNIHQINSKKTAVLFFDMLNVYYHAVPEEKQKAHKTRGRQRRAPDERRTEGGMLDLLRHGQSSD